MEWGDLKYFLAVARSGSTLAAGKLLGVNQTTVARRIAALEEALGEKIFERTAGGYKLSGLGASLVAPAEKVEGEIAAFSRLAAQNSPRRSHLLRVTTNDVFANVLVTPWLGDFSARFPHVQVEMIVDDRRLDLERGEADIAIRASYNLPEGDSLIVRSLGSWGMWGVYAGRRYVARNGKPYHADELAQHVIIGAAGALAGFEPEIWKKARAMGARVHSASSSIANIATSVRAGLGIGTLPCMVGELDPEMELCFTIEELRYEMMLIMRAELRHVPHVRAFNDFVVARTAALRHIIEGPQPRG